MLLPSILYFIYFIRSIMACCSSNGENGEGPKLVSIWWAFSCGWFRWGSCGFTAHITHIILQQHNIIFQRRVYFNFQMHTRAQTGVIGRNEKLEVFFFPTFLALLQLVASYTLRRFIGEKVFEAKKSHQFIACLTAKTIGNWKLAFTLLIFLLFFSFSKL